MTYAQLRVRPQTTLGLRGFLDPARPSHKWCLAATVSLSGFLVGMSQMAVQVALPQIMTGFGLYPDHAQWVITAYTIAGALVVPAVGWLGQRLGNRRLYFLSLLVFLTTSTLCAFAWSGTALITLRILQGLGGGSIAPMTMTFLSGVFPPDQRGRAMGFFGMGQTAGPILGTALGGYLTEYLSWRMVFLINTVPGVLCLVMVLLVLPNLRDEGKPTFDGFGLLSLATMLVSLLVALSQGHREGWDAPFIQRLFVVAGVAFVAFLVRELSSADPLIDLRLYTNRTFAAVSGLMLLFFMAFTGSTFLQVILVQRLLDYTPQRRLGSFSYRALWRWR
jgi:MFS transporter, DHA2 family, multidrug resistance protein